MTEESQSMEVVTGGALAALTKGEVESQIDIAKRYPRSLDKFVKRATGLACIDKETAASCLYHRPVGRDKDGKQVFADGMSVRMAEIVGASYGNLRVHAMIIDQTERQVIARGMAIDLEANFASSAEVVESTIDSRGQPYNERLRTLIAKVALAKARRDATFQVVPRALAKPIEAEVQKLLLGSAKGLKERRDLAVQWIESLKIDAKRVYSALGISGPGDLTAEILTILTGIRTAIKDNETSLDEAFPVPEIKKPRAASDSDGSGDAETSPSSSPSKKTRESKPANGKKTEEPAEDKTEEEIEVCLKWLETAPAEEIVAESNFITEHVKNIKGWQNQVKVLAPLNDKKEQLRGQA